MIAKYFPTLNSDDAAVICINDMLDDNRNS